MDLQRLSEFLLIAEEGSFKKASVRLGLSPSVLSTRFSTFEAALGWELFQRKSDGLKLTPQGKILLKHARSLLDSYDNILSSMEHINKASFQRLRIMLCAHTMMSTLTPFLKQFCSKYPKLFLGLQDENSCRLTDGLKSGEIDIAFAVGKGDSFPYISGRLPIGHFQKLKVIVPEDHRLAGKSVISFQELSGETFIPYPLMKEPCTRDLQLSLLEQSGISYHLYEEDFSPFFYEQLVSIGKGIRLWNWSNNVLPGSSLVTIRDEGYDTYLYLLYNTDIHNEATSRFIHDFLSFRKER